MGLGRHRTAVGARSAIADRCCTVAAAIGEYVSGAALAIDWGGQRVRGASQRSLAGSHRDLRTEGWHDQLEVMVRRYSSAIAHRNANMVVDPLCCWHRYRQPTTAGAIRAPPPRAAWSAGDAVEQIDDPHMPAQLAWRLHQTSGAVSLWPPRPRSSWHCWKTIAAPDEARRGSRHCRSDRRSKARVSAH